MFPKTRAGRFDLIASAIALVLLFLVAWFAFPAWHEKDPHRERYETMYKTIVFDFNGSSSETKTLEIGLTLHPEQLKGARDVQAFVKMRGTELDRYPDSASGTVVCRTLIFVNGEEWYNTGGKQTIASSRNDEWRRGHDETLETYWETIIPDYYEETHILDRLDRNADNTLRATVTCTSQVNSTGPTLVIVKFGPMWVDVTT